VSDLQSMQMGNAEAAPNRASCAQKSQFKVAPQRRAMTTWLVSSASDASPEVGDPKERRKVGQRGGEMGPEHTRGAALCVALAVHSLG